MSDKFELDGKEYKMTGDPSLRTVRHVQNMQMKMILNYVDEEDLREMDSLDDESEIIQAILDSGGMDALQDVMWERSLLEPVQTISLACDEVLDIDDVESLSALDFKDIKNDAEDAIGGSASDFFNELGIGTVLSQAEMQQAKQ